MSSLNNNDDTRKNPDGKDVAWHASRHREAVLSRRLDNPLNYNDYLGVEKLLNLQHPESAIVGREAHDEHLFIIIHQVYELWFKQILHELDSVIELFKRDFVADQDMGIIITRLHRITEIQRVLLSQLNVLETMSPLNFLEFRDYLFPASGFQSWQFRLLENKLGLKREQRITYGKRKYTSYLCPHLASTVEEVENEPSLYDLVQRWLERTPFLKFGGFEFWNHYRSAVLQMLEEDAMSINANAAISDQARREQLEELENQKIHFDSIFDSKQHQALMERGDRRLSFHAMQAALLITLYQDEPMLQSPSRILALLQDVDELMTSWRYRHALMVHRMLGVKIGTGGSSGYHYLRATAAKHKIFNDLFNLSTFLIPRFALPPLPTEVASRLQFTAMQPYVEDAPVSISACPNRSHLSIGNTKSQDNSKLVSRMALGVVCFGAIVAAIKNMQRPN